MDSHDLPILYKGAGPGTYWHTNDATQSGFTTQPGIANRNQIVNHITANSRPPIYLSFTTSFAVAKRYALYGTSRATQANPGFVYSVNLMNMPNFNAYDPVAEISAGMLIHGHTGDQRLVVRIALDHKRATTLQVDGPNGTKIVPSFSTELRGLTFALRDAEIVIGGNVLASAVIDKLSVQW